MREGLARLEMATDDHGWDAENKSTHQNNNNLSLVIDSREIITLFLFIFNLNFNYLFVFYH